MAQDLRDRVETDLVEHPEWADRHLEYPHPASVYVLKGGYPFDYQVERLPLHRSEDRIEDVAVVFLLVMVGIWPISRAKASRAATTAGSVSG